MSEPEEGVSSDIQMDQSFHHQIQIQGRHKLSILTEKVFFYKKIGFIREGLKKINYGKFHTRGGVSEGHFPYPIFKFFFAPNGLKIIFRH